MTHRLGTFPQQVSDLVGNLSLKADDGDEEQQQGEKAVPDVVHWPLADGADATATETIGGEVAGGDVGFLEIEFQAPGLDGIATIDG